MIPALRAETRRLLSRRITLVALLGILALVGLYQLQLASEVRPPTAAERAELQQEYDDYVKDWEANHEEWEADCVDSGESPEDCAMPRPEPGEMGLGPTAFNEAVPFALGFGVYLGGLVLFVTLASFVGAEASSGALANWLTFVPDRNRVLASKLIVAAGFSVLVGAAIGLLTVGVAALLTSAFGQPLTGLPEMAAMAGRGVIVVTILGLLGFCAGMLTLSTGASIGVLLGGIFVIYTRLALVYMTRWAGELSPWSPEVNLQAVLTGKATYEIMTGRDDDSDFLERTVTLTHGLGYWAVLLALVITGAWLLFRRRDVT